MKLIILTFTLIMSLSIYAQDFSNISDSDLDGIMQDFSANMVHTSVTGAGSAAIFGFELGLIGSVIDAPNVKESTTDTDKLINGGIYAQIALPLGFGAEAIIAPIEVDGLSYSYQSIAGYWKTNLSMLDMKIKGFVTSGDIEMEDPNNGNVKYEYSGYGANILIGKSILVFEPYIGLGYVSGESKMNATGIFNNGAVQAKAAGGIDTSDTYFMAGANVNLLFVRLGLEFSNPYGNTRTAAKVAFGF